jgi:type I restriction enzyme M protein
MVNKNDISKEIRSVRDSLGLSQEELAARLNVSFATINRWENGKSKPQKAQREAIEELYSQVVNGNGASSGDSDTAEDEVTKPSTRRRRGTSQSDVLNTKRNGQKDNGHKNMEQMLWQAACSIRGEKDAPKFKDYLLPLLFIKRLSDVFDDEVQRLIETYGDKDTALAILEEDHSLVRFYIPPEARWGVVSGREAFRWNSGKNKVKQPKTLGEQLTTTIRTIVKHNPTLAGVIDIVDYNETRNGEREISDSALKGVIETFSDPRYRLGLQDVEPDFLGRCYEYLLRKFAEGQGQSAGEFFTPTEVGFLIAELMRPRPGEECYDYACGSFGLLIKLQLVCKQLDPLKKIPLKLYGQELTGSSFAIACMNKIIHDMEGEILRGDSMRNPKFKESDGRLKKFDIVVANPMWNQPFDSDVFNDDKFNRFEEQGGVTTSKGDWAWLQHTLASMKDSGRAAVVLDTGAVSRGSGSKNEDKERNIRKWFVEKDYIEGVILLPDNLFYNTTAPGVIIVLNKKKPKAREGKIILINASGEFKKGQPKNYLPPEVISEVARLFAKFDDVDGLVKVISREEVAKQDFNLSPSRYVSSKSGHQTRPLNEIVIDWKALRDQSKSLDCEIDHILQGLL